MNISILLFVTISFKLAGAFFPAVNVHRTMLKGTMSTSTDICTPGQSKASVSINSVVEAINKLYPPDGLDQRIALSRKDGYWPYISVGEEPPKKYVYGEFDICLLEQAIRKACGLMQKDDEDIIFCDLGSGTGRLILATAAIHPKFKRCHGIELLRSIHEKSLEVADSLVRQGQRQQQQSQQNDDKKRESIYTELFLPSDDGQLPLAPVKLECASFDSPYSSFYDANILFCFSSCLNSDSLTKLARSIGRQCLPGTIVITTEYQLPSSGQLPAVQDDKKYPCGEYEIECVEKFSGQCTAFDGEESQVFIHRVLKSVSNGQRRVKPKIPVSELAFRAIRYMEEADTKNFLVQVRNQMAFLDFPESWMPKV